MEINKNDVLIAGLVEKVEYSNEIYGEIFHRCYVNIERTSGIIDTIPVNISDKLANVGDLIGKFIKVTGHYRSYNKKDGEKTKLILYVFANSVEILENPENINEANIEGFVVKPVTYRKTPSGREISDIILAVNRMYGKSDYIPCITWGRNAVFAERFQPGDKISITGRIQSREYTKKINDEDVTYTAYEVSVNRLTKEESKEENADTEENAE